MTPGYLHFDVRRGLTADLLNGAMATLLPSSASVKEAFESLNLGDISFVIGPEVKRGLNGTLVHFYLGDCQIHPQGLLPSQEPPSVNAKRPLWHGEKASFQTEPKIPTIELAALHNDLLFMCLSGDKIPLQTLREVFLAKKLKPAVSALALRILDALETKVFSEHNLKSMDALWLLCHLIMLVVQIDVLDPKFITATKLLKGVRQKSDSLPYLCVSDDIWLNQILQSVPVIEGDDTIEMDVLGAAFIKTLVGQFGARGESTILQVGIGLSGISDCAFMEALWCEASLPKSMSECGPSNAAQLNFIYEVSGAVSASTEMSQLTTTMSLHGATSINWHLVHGEKKQTFCRMSFLCSDEDKREIIEAFLIKGGAYDVIVRPAEQHQLNRRLVSVPLSTGNKASSARFYEYIYYDKIVRTEPLNEDLDAYVQKTDYSVDVARSDLLSAWKKWRGRVISENE